MAGSSPKLSLALGRAVATQRSWKNTDGRMGFEDRVAARLCSVPGSPNTSPRQSRKVHFFELGAQDGYHADRVNLGYFYDQGLGVPQGHAAAAHWYRRAAEAAKRRLSTISVIFIFMVKACLGTNR